MVIVVQPQRTNRTDRYAEVSEARVLADLPPDN